MARGRPDRDDYLRTLGLPSNADPIEILTVSGGYRVTDAYDLFSQTRERGRRTICVPLLSAWLAVRHC